MKNLINSKLGKIADRITAILLNVRRFTSIFVGSTMAVLFSGYFDIAIAHSKKNDTSLFFDFLAIILTLILPFFGGVIIFGALMFWILVKRDDNVKEYAKSEDESIKKELIQEMQTYFKQEMPIYLEQEMKNFERSHASSQKQDKDSTHDSES